MVKLKKLYLDYNQIKKVEGLEGQRNSLHFLSLTNNNLGDFKFSILYIGKALKEIRVLNIEGNPVKMTGENRSELTKETLLKLESLDGDYYGPRTAPKKKTQIWRCSGALTPPPRKSRLAR